MAAKRLKGQRPSRRVPLERLCRVMLLERVVRAREIEKTPPPPTAAEKERRANGKPPPVARDRDANRIQKSPRPEVKKTKKKAAPTNDENADKKSKKAEKPKDVAAKKPAESEKTPRAAEKKQPDAVRKSSASSLPREERKKSTERPPASRPAVASKTPASANAAAAKRPLTITTSSSSPVVAKRPSVGPTTPKAPLAKRPSTSGPASGGGGGLFDIFDSILTQQDEMLKERNKSEDAKAAERVRMELENRRKKGDLPLDLVAQYTSEPMEVDLGRETEMEHTPTTIPMPPMPAAVPDSPHSQSADQPPPAAVPLVDVQPAESTGEVPMETNEAEAMPQPTSDAERPKAAVEFAPTAVEKAVKREDGPAEAAAARLHEAEPSTSADPQADVMALYHQSQSIFVKQQEMQEKLSEFSLDMIPIPDSPEPYQPMCVPGANADADEPPVEGPADGAEAPNEAPTSTNNLEGESPTKAAAEADGTEVERPVGETDDEEDEAEVSMAEDEYEGEDVEEEEEEDVEDEEESRQAEPNGTSAQPTAPISNNIPLDPSTLLRLGDEVLKAFGRKADGSKADGSEVTYGQVLEDPEPNTSTAEGADENGETTNAAAANAEPKPLPEFYGEPVPDDDDNDDALFELAAGLPPRKKRQDEEVVINEEPPPDDSQIELDYYNADMNIKADAKDKWLIDPDNGDGFALMWGCVKATFGIQLKSKNTKKIVHDDWEMIPADPVTSSLAASSSSGSQQAAEIPEVAEVTPAVPTAPLPPIVYQVRIVEFLSLKSLPFEEHDPYDLRVGWSSSQGQQPVGETDHSYAFCRMGRKASGNHFQDYGQTVEIGDIVTVYLDVEAGEIRYFVNDTDLGVAFANINFQHPHSNAGPVIHPHIGLKNVKVAVNFGNEEPPAADAPANRQWRLPAALADRPPGSFRFFGCLDRQSVNGIPRKRVHQGRWDMIMGLAAKALARALTLACRRRHSYIIDQTNVSRESRRRKLSLFKDFLRRCVVIVPSAEDFEHRQLRQARAEPANQIPPEAMLELKGMMSIPEVGVDPVEDVVFIEPNSANLSVAIDLVRRYNEEGKPYLQNKRRPHKGRDIVLSDNRGTSAHQWGA
ncbi:Heterogeneous nuclear ribonucleoprotein U-like protein 1 [Aphelenchoides fujianensis]|nr:Heterogeneous nuclear ribonucleoprotein U-like protein 1 [Aphelenchoides fujianensis]